MYTLCNSNKKIIHIIEHPGYGTLHQLVLPLSADERQEVICTNGNNNMTFFENKIYIIHTTGHMYPIISDLENLIKANIKIVVFLHVSTKYLFLKEKQEFIVYLRDIQQKYGIKFLCPSKEVSNEYLLHGIDVDSLQIGVSKTSFDGITDYKKEALNKYIGKIITVCTNSDSRYLYIKGIDTFYDLMKFTNNIENSLILGFNGEYKGIPCIKLTNDEFLYVLSKSKLYIQLSRTECYNVTAVQAKQLKVPVIVSNIEGHKNSVPNLYSRVETFEDSVEKIMSFTDKLDVNEIEKNYCESMRRENILNFMTEICEYVWRLSI